MKNNIIRKLLISNKIIISSDEEKDKIFTRNLIDSWSSNFNQKTYSNVELNKIIFDSFTKNNSVEFERVFCTGYEYRYKFNITEYLLNFNIDECYKFSIIDSKDNVIQVYIKDNNKNDSWIEVNTDTYITLDELKELIIFYFNAGWELHSRLNIADNKYYIVENDFLEKDSTKDFDLSKIKEIKVFADNNLLYKIIRIDDNVYDILNFPIGITISITFDELKNFIEKNVKKSELGLRLLYSIE